MSTDGGRYAKISARFWRDERVARWTDDIRLLALYLLSCPHRNATGYYYLPLEYVVADLGWPAKRVRKSFDGLISDGFVAYDEKLRIVLVRRALKYDSPANPNQTTAAVRQVGALPPSPLLETLMANADLYAPKLGGALREAFDQPIDQPSDNGCATVQDPLPQRSVNAVAVAVAVSRSRITEPHSAAERFAEPTPLGEPATPNPADLSQATGPDPERNGHEPAAPGTPQWEQTKRRLAAAKSMPEANA